MREEKNYVVWRIMFIGFLSTIITVILKIANYFPFSWGWALSPLWISVSLVCLIIMALVVHAFWIEDRKQRGKADR